MAKIMSIINSTAGFGGLMLACYLGLNLLFFRDNISIIMGLFILGSEIGIILYCIQEGIKMVFENPGVKVDRHVCIQHWGHTKLFFLRILSPSVGILVSLYSMRFEELFLVAMIYFILSLISVPLLYIEDLFC